AKTATSTGAGVLDNFTTITNSDPTTKGTYSFELGTNFEPGKTITIGGITLTEGAAGDFIAGGDTDATAANIVAAYNSTAPAPPYVASVSGSTITFTEKTASGAPLTVTSTSNPVLDTVIATTTPGDTTTGINNPTSTSDTGKLSKLKIPKMLNGDQLETFAIDSSGLVSAVYGGTTYYLGRVAVSKFSNPEGLEKVGNNCYVDTDNSGDIQVGQAGRDGFGTIKSSTVEMSNVDLANEFTEMIITSRAYSANSRTITTSDEMLQELLNLKR
ncbi:MAG: flagellar hook-basal body complex protein, partial [Clostridia bacterium]|nr:flagellar hook-basal body complex protein [Clostridia bacterium]